MSILERNRTIFSAFFLSVFFSLINTPLYFDSEQISNQGFLAVGNFNIPLQIFPLICIFLFFCGANSKLFIQFTLSCVLLFLIASLPEMPNHRYVLLVVASYLLLIGYSKDGNVSSVELANFSQMLISIIYFFAFLAKLNTSYLNTEISCASIFYDNVKLSSISFLPSNKIVHLFSIYSSIIFEGLAFVFILNKRFRPYIVFIGMGFHFALSLDLIKYFTNFSSIMYFLLFSSLGSSAYAEVERKVRNHPNFKKLFHASLLSILLLCLVSGLDTFAYKEQSLVSLILLRHLLWLSVALFAIQIVFSMIKYWPKVELTTLNIRLVPLGLLFFFVISCLGPYLGIKTRSALTMYSNLRMEKDYSNHLIFNKSLDALGFLNSTALVIETKDRCSTKLSEGLAYPLFEIVRVDKTCPGEITKIHFGNDDIEYTDIRWKEVMALAHYPLLFKLLLFGPVGSGAEKECVW